MDCSFAKDFASPLATVIAAVVAVYVTWRLGSGQTKIAQQQAETARREAQTAKDQLRLNLFEKRYAVYKDIQGGLSDTLTNAYDKSETASVVARLFVAFDEAALFFSAATCEWLRTVRDDYQAFRDANSMRREGNGDPRQHHDLQNKLVGHLRSLQERFRVDLGFSQPTSD